MALTSSTIRAAIEARLKTGKDVIQIAKFEAYEWATFG